MDSIDAINEELKRLYDYQIQEGGWTYTEFADLLKPLHNALVRTTEDASQTVREGELLDEDGLVQSPDNAVTSGDTETNDSHDSKEQPIDRALSASQILELARHQEMKTQPKMTAWEKSQER
jgi:hypothetical protein